MTENIKQPKTSRQFLLASVEVQGERGAEYEGEGKEERSFNRIAKAFSAITQKELTAAEIALVLQITKDVRQWSHDRFHADSVLDSVSYAALKAEELYIQYKANKAEVYFD